MKKFITVLRCFFALVLFGAVILALAADTFIIAPSSPIYDPTQDPSAPGDSGEDSSYDPSVPPDGKIPNWSITPTVIKNTLVSSNGKTLCETRYSYPTVSSNDSSDITAFSAALEKISNEVRLYVDTRSDLYKAGSQGSFSVVPQITGHYTVNRFSSEVFSITFIFSEISPSGTVSETRMNYNLDILLSSDNVSIDAIMNSAAKTVKGILISKEANGEISLLSNYEDVLSGIINDVWTIKANGILFYFPGGTVASSSYGDVEIFIKTSELSSLISEYGKILLNISN